MVPEDPVSSQVAEQISPGGQKNLRQNTWIFFGTGTKLFVEAQTQPVATPSVFVMKNGTKVACLAKDFYPKEISVEFQPTIETYPKAVTLSPNGKYSAVQIGHSDNANSVTCSVQHNKKSIASTEFEPKTDSSDPSKKEKPTDTETATVSENTQKTPESENKQQISEKPKGHTCFSVVSPISGRKFSPLAKPPSSLLSATVYPEKVNMMSLTVLGLRMLFAKSIALNVFLTAKLFFF
ncbi:T cell receptor delta constant [Galemys pyrenaicus]|nr:T cell receptor delta constant [Galemys pyrenaicus]